MNKGIHHPHYRVVPAGFAYGFWVGFCKLCKPENRYQTAKNGSAHNAEKALWDHLKDAHKIDMRIKESQQ